MTAEPLAKRTGLELEIEPLLEERNFGDLRGTPYSQLPDGHPFGPDLQPPHGENWQAFHARVKQAFELIVERSKTTQGNLVVFTHGLVLSSIVELLVPCAAGLHAPGSFDNTSITLLDASAPYTVRLVNDVAHLPSGHDPATAGTV